MILRRLGNKQGIAEDIVKYFPLHTIYIELFFGAGGIFFNKPKAKFNFCNDIDDEIINLFDVAKERKQELIEEIESTPTNDTLFKRWKKQTETDPIKKAMRFLYLSNYSYMGTGSLRFTAEYSVKTLLNNCMALSFDNYDVKFMNTDFRKVIGKIAWRDEDEKQKAFVYADPPYLGTNGNYDSFSEQDTTDLFQTLVDSKMRFAISEFDNEFVIDLAKRHNLNTNIIGERNNLRNRRTEILITNYISQPTLFT